MPVAHASLGGITHPPILPDRAVVGSTASSRAFVVKVMIPAVRHPFGILESPVVWPWGRGGVGGLPFAALALRGPRSFSPLLGLLPLSLPHLGCLALALPLRSPLMFLRASERVALCKQQGGVARGRFPAGYVLRHTSHPTPPW